MIIQPAKIERDEDGFWTHPDFPAWDEDITSETIADWKDENEVNFDCVMFDGDAPEYLEDRYYDRGDLTAVAEWDPVCKRGVSFLLSIHDTEDGPVALFAIRRSVLCQ